MSPSISSAAPPGGRPRLLRAAIDILLGVALLGLALFAHLPLAASPLQDDGSVAFDNPAVRAGAPAWNRAPFYADQYRPLWRPLATLTLRWNWIASPAAVAEPGLGEMRAARTEMARVNLALFALLVVLAFLLLRTLKLDRWVAFGAAALLALHPVNVESVARVAGRSDLLAGVFGLGALVLYIGVIARRGPKGNAPLWVAWGGAFLLALLGSEAALILPLLVVGYEAICGAGPRVRRGATALLIAVAVTIVWFAAREGVLRGLPWGLTRNPASDYVRALTGAERVRLALYLPLFYAGLLFMLTPALPDYAHLLSRPASAPDIVLGDPRTYGLHIPGAAASALGLLVLLAVFALAWRLRRSDARAGFGAWILGVGLLLALPLFATNGHVASTRVLFFPLLGLALLLGALGETLARRLRVRARWTIPAAAGAAALAILGLAASQARGVNGAWQSQDSLMERLARAAPLSPEVPLYRGANAMTRGDLTQAASCFETSLGLFPRNPRVLLNLGLIRAQQQQFSVAARVLHDAAVASDRILPRSAVAAKAHLSLGTLLGRQNLEDAALVEFEKALEADSTNVSVLASAGVLEALKYATARAGIRHINRAFELDPDGRVLGALAQRAREVRDRATINLSRLAASGAYEAGMSSADSSASPGARE